VAAHQPEQRLDLALPIGDRLGSNPRTGCTVRAPRRCTWEEGVAFLRRVPGIRVEPSPPSLLNSVAAVRAICEAEMAAYRSAVDAARVAPTVVALRAKAATVVDAELARLAGRLSADSLSARALDEIAQTMRRVVDKLLHAPTVRVKELAGSPGGEEYAAALRVLFDLDPRAVEAVTRAAREQEAHDERPS